MTFNIDTLQHLRIVNADFVLATQRLTECLRNEDKQHQLPGAIADCNESLAAIINAAGAADPAILQAMAHGRRSTQSAAIVAPRDYAPGDELAAAVAP